MASNVFVCARFRPASRTEQSDGSTYCVAFDDRLKTVSINTAAFPAGASSPTSIDSKARYTFDAVFDERSSQSLVYEKTAKPLISEVFKGYNATVFAYGQTGSGKTHSMMGDMNKSEGRGIIPRMVEAIFQGIEEADPDTEFTVRVSFVEIYNEKIRDLLNNDEVSGYNLKIRESSSGGVYIESVLELYVSSFMEVLEIMQQGALNRAQASTNMNAESSRSHSVFLMTVSQLKRSSQTKTEAKLYLVDLAGSEKVAKTGATGQTLEEAKNINRSLSALGNVINALTSNSPHIPYRDSKLTRLLSDSLGGNCRTSLIITCSPMSSNVEETISTLRFGVRAKTIKNKPKVNQERSVAEYKRLLSHAYHQIRIQAAIIQAQEGDIERLQAFYSRLEKSLPDGKSLLKDYPLPELSNKSEIIHNAKKFALAANDEEIDFNQLEELALKGDTITKLLQNTINNPPPPQQSTQRGNETTTTAAAAVVTPLPLPSTAEENEEVDIFNSSNSHRRGSSSNPFANFDTTAPPSSVPFPSLDEHTPQQSPSRSSSVSFNPDVFSSMPARLTSLTLRTAELEARLGEIEQEKLQLQHAIQERESEIEEQKRETIDNEKKWKIRLEDIGKKADQLDQKQREFEQLQQEFDLLKKKMDLMEKEHAYQISQMNEFLPSALPMDMNTPPRPVKQTMVSTPSSPAPLSPTTASLLAAGIGPLSPPTTAPAPAPAPSRKIPLLGSLLGLAGVSVAGITSSSTPVSKESHPLSGGNNNSNNDIGGLNVSVSGSTDKDAQIFTLMNALKAKCDQYIKLRAAHVDQSLHISALESALTDANRRFNESQVGPQRKIQELEEKLARTELLSKQFVDNKKIDSGRLFALRGGSNIAKPAMIVSLQGGGKRISNAISSSSLSSSSSSSSSYNNNNNNNNNNNKNDNPSSPSAPIAASINNRRSSGGFFARLTGTSSNNNNNPTSPRSNDTNKPQSPEIKLTSMGSLRGNMSNNNNNNNNNSSDSTNNNE